MGHTSAGVSCELDSILAQNSSSSSKCFDQNSTRSIEQLCIGKKSCLLTQTDWQTDPCPGLFKSVFVQATCSTGEGVATTRSPVAPGPPKRNLRAQQAFVLQLPGSEDVLWAGDRWESAPDNFKSHDFQVWVPLEFDREGLIKPLQWQGRWTTQINGAAPATITNVASGSGSGSGSGVNCVAAKDPGMCCSEKISMSACWSATGCMWSTFANECVWH